MANYSHGHRVGFNLKSHDAFKIKCKLGKILIKHPKKGSLTKLNQLQENRSGKQSIEFLSNSKSKKKHSK